MGLFGDLKIQINVTLPRVFHYLNIFQTSLFTAVKKTYKSDCDWQWFLL